ncbi:MAG TPA: NfeD family protein [Solirubrobacteraceae bacterium]|jgi:membrane-bound serine protease (ClpP class)
MTAIGIALLVVGVIAVLVEAHVPSLGILGAPGVVALAAGAVLAVAGLGGGIALGVVAGLLVAGSGLGVVGLSVSKGAAVRKRRHRSGLIGRLGVVRKWSQPEGTVLVDGALWNACPSLPDGEEICAGDRVVVERVSGLTLAVRKAEDWELVA